jgi:hypothetical protein
MELINNIKRWWYDNTDAFLFKMEASLFSLDIIIRVLR